MKNSTKRKIIFSAVLVGWLGTTLYQNNKIDNLEVEKKSLKAQVVSLKKKNKVLLTQPNDIILQDGQVISTDKFDLTYSENNQGEWYIDLTPHKGRFIGNQGNLAKGVELTPVDWSCTDRTISIETLD